MWAEIIAHGFADGGGVDFLDGGIVEHHAGRTRDRLIIVS